jgi:hypothetical protein
LPDQRRRKKKVKKEKKDQQGPCLFGSRQATYQNSKIAEERKVVSYLVSKPKAKRKRQRKSEPWGYISNVHAQF